MGSQPSSQALSASLIVFQPLSIRHQYQTGPSGSAVNSSLSSTVKRLGRFNSHLLNNLKLMGDSTYRLAGHSPAQPFRRMGITQPRNPSGERFYTTCRDSNRVQPAGAQGSQLWATPVRLGNSFAIPIITFLPGEGGMGSRTSTDNVLGCLDEQSSA
ncbi:hypothetical protein CMUS01_15573 [Colletotrichum musicola]|uniref:Uncharacterized protein n=1 Tax=Colletotrichum musicola TaxID=2175873 RepID=A0A8H6MML4_9PEZI|nr:hypothetical protein CMUS01_15573 [Colletotrichum musicola]